MSFNAWPDQVIQDDKFVGHEVVQRPTFLEPLVPDVAASVHSAESLSRALSAAIESHERLLSVSSHISSDELMRATIERSDAMSSVRDSLNDMPPDAVLDEPMIRQKYPQGPMWLPQLMQRALGGSHPLLAPASPNTPRQQPFQSCLKPRMRPHQPCIHSGNGLLLQIGAPGLKAVLAPLSAALPPQSGPCWDSVSRHRQHDVQQHKSNNMPTWRTSVPGLSPLHRTMHPSLLMQTTTVLSPNLAPMGQLQRLPMPLRATTYTLQQLHQRLCRMAKVSLNKP